MVFRCWVAQQETNFLPVHQLRRNRNIKDFIDEKPIPPYSHPSAYSHMDEYLRSSDLAMDSSNYISYFKYNFYSPQAVDQDNSQVKYSYEKNRIGYIKETSSFHLSKHVT